MKKIILLSIALSYIPFSSAVTSQSLVERGSRRLPQNEKIFAQEQAKKSKAIKDSIKQKIGGIKYAMLIGNLERAKLEIFKIKNYGVHEALLPILERYMAMIAFIEEDYEKVSRILSHPRFAKLENFKQVCHLKVLTNVILDKKDKLWQQWRECKSLFNRYSESNQLWFDSLVRLKVDESDYVTRKPFSKLISLNYSTERTRVWLKLALYLNEFGLTKPYLNQIPTEMLSDEEIRETIGFLYFRENQLVKSYRFIEDLNTPNAENIKGNLYLMQNKLELAYAQYKLALLKKSNSLNAAERALPLSWLLKQWNEGKKLSQNLRNQPGIEQHNRISLKAAFLVELGKYDNAQKELDKILYESNNQQALEVNQLYTYTSLQKNDPKNVKFFSAMACAQFDALNCWTAMQSDLWGDLTKTIKRDVLIIGAPQNFISSLINQKNHSTLNEDDYFVEQRDIEELDESLMHIEVK